VNQPPPRARAGRGALALGRAAALLRIDPGLLTADVAMQAIIREHPGLLWRALNTQRRLGGATTNDKSTEPSQVKTPPQARPRRRQR